MKKVLVLILTLTLTLSLSLSALADPGKGNNGNGKGNGGNKADTQTAADTSDKAKTKQFKQEMNQYVKDPVGALQGDLDSLKAAKEALQDEIDALDPSDPDYDADLAALTDEMTELDGQITDITTKLATDPESLKKQFINERFMVIKSGKSGFDLSLYDNAQALIAAMYTAAEDPDTWTLWTNKSENLMKLEGPLYLKGGKIMFPLAAMRDLGAEVTWDETTKTVTVVGANGISVVFSPEGKAATTQASVANSAIVFEDGAVAGEKTGTITGTITDPVTGVVYNVEAMVELALPVDENGVITDENIPPDTILTANIVDENGAVIKTVEVELTGTLSSTDLAFAEVSLDVRLSNTVNNCGRAYHPLNELAEVFGLEVTADVAEGIVEVAPAGEVTEEAVTEAV